MTDHLIQSDAWHLLRAASADAGWWFPRSGRAHDLYLFGVRNPLHRVGPWACALGAARIVDGSPQVKVWRGTTLPGREGTQAHDPKLHPRGVAAVVPGQHRGVWELGTHKRGRPGAHAAYVQRAGAVIPVYRDTVRDGVVNGGQVHTDGRGLNGHRAWREGLHVVGDASHGCIVWARADDHAEAVAMGRDQVRHLGAETFSLTLWDGADHPELWCLLSAVGVAYDAAWYDAA